MVANTEITACVLIPQPLITPERGVLERDTVCVHHLPDTCTQDGLKNFLRKHAACPIQKVTLGGAGKGVVNFRRAFGKFLCRFDI